jgi:hypothetical protein
MANENRVPARGAVFWPVGNGDSTTVVANDPVVLQVDLHDMAKADEDLNPEGWPSSRTGRGATQVDGRPYLGVFALTHADKEAMMAAADSTAVSVKASTDPVLFRHYRPDLRYPSKGNHNSRYRC